MKKLSHLNERGKIRMVTNAPTGVEMEALTVVSVAAPTVYHMCKAIQKDIEITEIKLESKTGGKSNLVKSEK